jgi:hypothetical protein
MKREQKMTELPKRPRPHILESISRSYFGSLMINAGWIVRDVSLDYGLDLNVEIVEKGQVTGKNFSVQLKATDNSLRHRTTPSIKLKNSTLEYIRSRLEPVMIVYFWSEPQK